MTLVTWQQRLRVEPYEWLLNRYSSQRLQISESQHVDLHGHLVLWDDLGKLDLRSLHLELEVRLDQLEAG